MISSKSYAGGKLPRLVRGPLCLEVERKEEREGADGGLKNPREEGSLGRGSKCARIFCVVERASGRARPGAAAKSGEGELRCFLHSFSLPLSFSSSLLLFCSHLVLALVLSSHERERERDSPTEAARTPSAWGERAEREREKERKKRKNSMTMEGANEEGIDAAPPPPAPAATTSAALSDEAIATLVALTGGDDASARALLEVRKRERERCR